MHNKTQPTSKQLLFFPLFFVLYETISYLSNDAYLPAMPIIQESFNTSQDLVRLSLTSWFLGGALIQLLVGPLSDYFGRRKMMIYGGVVFVLSSLGCALSNSIIMLILMRLIEGATIATMAVSGYATIHAMYDTITSIKKIALMNSVSILAPALGPLVGALMMHWWEWHVIFYALAFSAIIPLLLLQSQMPETADVKQSPLNFKVICGRYKRIIANRSFMIYLLSSRMLFSAMIVWLTAGPFLIYVTFKMSTLHFGYAQVIVFGAYIIGTKINPWLMERCNLHTILWQGWAACLLGVLYCLIITFVGTHTIYSVLPGLMLITFGSGISLPIYSRLAIEQSEEPMGEKVAMTTFTMTVSGTLATLSINLFFNNSLLSLSLILTGFIVLGFLLFALSATMQWIHPPAISHDKG